MKKEPITNELFKINLAMTILTILGSTAIYFCTGTTNSSYTVLNSYLAFGILFAYFYLIIGNVKKNISELKKEVLYINYPLNIALFFSFIFLILISCAVCLFYINKEAINTATLFLFFLTVISLILPSVVLLVIIYFITPALIIPNLKTDTNSRKNYKYLYFFLLIVYIIVCLFNGFILIDKAEHWDSQFKYKSAKLSVNFSTDNIKIHKDISSYAKKQMSKDKLEIPFYYTKDYFTFPEYETAENFCKSINARIPNYLEAYNIAFSYFDILGDKYYLISDKDMRTPLVLHFKNMSYTVEKLPDNAKTILYCVSSESDNYGLKNKQYFYSNLKEIHEAKNSNQNGIQTDENEIDKMISSKINEDFQYEIDTEKKHVNFSVKEVNLEYMKSLISQGYNYNPEIRIKSEYEASDNQVNSIISRDSKNIKLCYYPFTQYDNMTINQEREIWEQSFCSPSFTLLNSEPAYISTTKDTYCAQQGGRLPNIPELSAILKVNGINPAGKKFWTNNIIGKNTAVIAYYQDEKFLNVQISDYNTHAYAYCIKEAETPSKVMANYKSKFFGYDGNVYSKQICPDCFYYEVPDVIVKY